MSAALTVSLLNSLLCSVSCATRILRVLIISIDTSSITKIIRSREHLFNTPIHFLQNSGLDLPIVGMLRIRKPRGILLNL
ncbi:hypothetical protein XELAEV_18027088mg [Xenopus laevis]|uniref:Secreted protein n=1 Tax=Xenopus laevis TaxID=8355 RepID=A0A974HJN6_XENLA|nr:hypothetical protein XELAEV_18027088mg [Xenopus laevis]